MICKVEGCGRVAYTRGYCPRCYGRKRTNGELQVRRNQKRLDGAICENVGCVRPASITGFCKKCYDVFRTPITVKRARVHRKSAIWESLLSGVCTYYGCSNKPIAGHRRCDLHLSKAKDKESNAYRAASRRLSLIRREHPNYAGLPFCAEWDPQKGGSLKTAEKWILDHLGQRPSSDGVWDLRMIVRDLGFVPENLAWVPRGAQLRQNFINQLLLEVRQLREEIRILKAAQ